MCGVLFARRRDKHPVKKALLKRYNKQASRGKRGFGFIALEKGRVVEVERFEEEGEAEKAVAKTTSSEILFHHRLPTSTPNYKDVTHPIVVENDELDSNYYLIHNGVLRNEHTLKDKHEKLGYVYTTIIETVETVKGKKGKIKEKTSTVFNDSESLAIEVARFIDGKSEKIDIVGSAAFIVFQTDKKGFVQAIHYARNDGNPLILENNGDLFFIKSEGEGEAVPPNVLFSVDYKTWSITQRDVAIGRSSYQTPSSPSYNPMGFGRDDERVHNFLGDERTRQVPLLDVPARSSRIVPSTTPDGITVGGVKNGEFQFNEDDLPFRNSKDMPTIQMDSDDVAVAFENYRCSEDYLLELWEECKNLQRDIKKCEENMANPSNPQYGQQFNEEYLDECQEILGQKEKEAINLEDQLASLGRG